MKYSKPPLAIKEQIQLLKSRGLEIADTASAEKFLSIVSYYRFSAYLLPFQLKDGSHSFKPFSIFEKALNEYLFDRELRHIVFNAIEKIEIALRAHLINVYSLAFGVHWYLQDGLFFSKELHDAHIERLQTDFKKSNETFIRHYRNKYNDPFPPAWMAVEAMSFGNLSKLYKNLKKGKEKNIIAHAFNLPDVLFESWLESLSYIRNICAHHARLWNRELTLKPKLPKRLRYRWLALAPSDSGRIYSILAIIQYLLRSIGDDGKFGAQIYILLDNNPAIPLHYMGFPESWRSDEFWT